MLTKKDLVGFIGTENYYKHAFGLLLTDGCKHVAEEGKAYWLFDAIGSYFTTSWYQKSSFINVKLIKHEDNSATLSFEDGNDNLFHKQEIEYTDFPLKDISFFVQEGGVGKVCMLPSEY